MVTGWIHKHCGTLKMKWLKNETAFQFLGGQLEECKSNDEKEHLQAFVQFKKRKSFKQVIAIFKPGVWHVERRKYSVAKCLKYVSKDDTKKGPYEQYGIAVHPKKSQNLSEIKEMIDEGASKRELWTEHFPTMSMRFRGVYEGMKQLQEEDEDPEFAINDFGDWRLMLDFRRTIILQGATEIGKSEFAKALLPNALWCNHKNDLEKFDKNRHVGIIFDDMTFNHWPPTSQIAVVDVRNKRTIDTKGGCATIPGGQPHIITTNVPYGKCVDLDVPQIGRRCVVIYLELDTSGKRIIRS